MKQRVSSLLAVLAVVSIASCGSDTQLATAPSSLPIVTGPLDASPAVLMGDFKTAMTLKNVEKEWGACFTAQGGKPPYNWELVLNQPENQYGDGLLISMGAKACFRPNNPTRFTLKLSDSASASLIRGGAFY